MKSLFYHFIGIGGIGMSALAHILLDRGYRVSGSDLLEGEIVQTLKNKGAKFFLGHREEHIPEGAVVVYGSGISQENPEFLSAKNRGHRLIHRAELLAELAKDQISIFVTGSHGKTTVSSLITAILQKLGTTPSFAIGGLNGDGINGGSGFEYFVAEADESDGSIQHYLPEFSVITNIDDEHLSNFGGDRGALLASLQDFAFRTRRSCWYNGDCSLLRSSLKGNTFGFSSSCDLHILSYRQEEWRVFFTAQYQGILYEDVEVQLAGEHNVMNAAAAMGIALSLGIDELTIRDALREFSGVQRRLQRKNVSETFLFLEDYAHHPSEISCTLQAVRAAVGQRRVLAICQPHRFSRLKECWERFPSAFKYADEVFLTEVYGAGEREEEVPYQELAQSISRESLVKCTYVPFQELKRFLEQRIRVHDVCVSLGAGNIVTLGESLQDFEPKKLSLGILCGGRSCEHDISILSAKNIARHLSSTFYEVQGFIITREGLWKKVSLLEGTEDSEKSIFDPEIAMQLERLDVVVPILHGPYGEDGAIQGFLETIGKPYTGPSVVFAAIGMNKVLTKRFMSDLGIPVVPYLPLTLTGWKQEPEKCLAQIMKAFSFPMFVKAAHLGSSIGVFEVHNAQELREAIHEAFVLDNDVFIEESRLGCKEIEVSFLGDGAGVFFVAGMHERRGSGGFIDYCEKYGLSGKPSAQIVFDVDLSQEMQEQLLGAAEKIYRLLQGKGSCRIDFLVDDEGSFWLSEMNPIPGTTESSPFLTAFVRKGWSCEQIIHQLVIDGLQRFDHRQRLISPSFVDQAFVVR
ncbi:bifunctional UDP-N-acetylmuramate--L-alanine ligase/D-alanine--D-alanine ligase [Chlamydia suis]|uniref:bifunctional UDP-N-acetylmuramate--L-alanine ligase/D-alanine--D-alanine ligase n=1 Tax=Chlamydia suis TaxID=83559 RepID=UPI0009B0603D|nr:bifunctional UDP-N-acetylmuramate--L-alanine ligase/D-alanine--D-alanine ligase [Chlamydia suis]